MSKTKSIIIIIIVLLIIGIGVFAYIQANSHNTKIDVISNSTLKNGDKVKIELTDEYRNNYPNENIHIKILDDSGWAHNYDVTTNKEGKASVVLETFENGNYTIHTIYNGTMFNKAYHGVTSLEIDDGY
ncbi:MAG: hypothetical protein E7Z80_00345 [Methanobrevibacter thaueri]|nr:hypothetical protein [Methanobrevibacter thaueri]